MKCNAVQVSGLVFFLLLPLRDEFLGVTAGVIAEHPSSPVRLCKKDPTAKTL